MEKNTRKNRIDLVPLGFDLSHEFLLALLDLGLPFSMGKLLGGEPFLGDLLSRLGFLFGILSDGGMCLLIHILHLVSGDTVLDEKGELTLECIFVIFLKMAHVIGYMLAEDVGTVDISAELAFLLVVTREAFFAVGNIETSVGSTLHGAKNFGSGGGTGKSNVKTGTESTRSFIVVFNHAVLTVDVGDTLVSGVQVHLFENPSCQKKTSAVGSGIVGQTNFNSIAGELVTVGGSNNPVSFKPGIGNLTTDILVGGSHDHAVLGGIVLVLVLDDQALPGKVVSFTLAPPPELNLETLEVSLALDNLDERHIGLFDA